MKTCLSCLVLATLALPAVLAQEEEYTLREVFAGGARCRITEIESTEVLLRSKGTDWGNRKQEMSWENRRRYVQTVEQGEEGGKAVLRREYELSEKIETSPGRSKPERTTTSASGQTVRAVLGSGGVEVQPAERLLSDDDKSAIRRWATTRFYLPKTPVAVLDRWTMEKKEIGYLFYGEGYNERDFIVQGEGTLKRVSVRRGRKIAECAIEITLENPRIGDFPAMRVEAKGILLWDMDGDRSAGLDLKGPIRLETTMPSDAGKVEVIGEGTWKASLEVDWLEDR